MKKFISKSTIIIALLSCLALVGCEENTYGAKASGSNAATIFWVSYIIGCVISGIICAAIMSSKGHDGTSGWFFLGFFLGIIGIIIAACQPNLYYINSLRNSQNPTSSSPLKKNQNTWVCKCGSRNNNDDSFCHSCGKANPKSLYSSSSRDGSWNCLCGAKNYANENECHRCGASKQDVFNSKQSSTTTESYWICKCGTINFSTRNYCKKCGEPNPKPIVKPIVKDEDKAIQEQPTNEQKSSTESIADQLKEFKNLLDQGLITEADFEAKKKQILGL